MVELDNGIGGVTSVLEPGGVTMGDAIKYIFQNNKQSSQNKETANV